jgi:oligopeptide/dipeptide ABC transporter ATP-binding protein
VSLLRVDALSVHAADVALPIVDALSFSIERSGSLAIVGESGSGKSQAVLSLLGLQGEGLCVAGSACFDGQQLIGAREAQLNALRGARIGFVFQDPALSLNPYLPIGVQIAESLEVHRGRTRAEALLEARRLLDVVRLADAARRLRQYPHELSGGMRQRVMIAVALACRPELLIADEPTTALDATVQQQIIMLLRELQREYGLALLLISHDLGLVGELCEQMLVLYAGRLMEAGRSADLLRAPRHPYTRALLRARPRLDSDPRDRLYAIPGVLDRARLRVDACRFAARCAHALPACGAAEPALRIEASVALRCHLDTGPIP